MLLRIRSKPEHNPLQQQLDVVQRVHSFMSTLSDLNQLLQQIMQESQNITDAEASCLALYNEARDEFAFEVVLGEKGAAARKIRIPNGEGVIGRVGASRKPCNVKDAYASKDFSARVDRSTGFRTRSILAVPMVRHDRLIGVIEVLNKKSRAAFSDQDQTILQLLADQAAIAIENARLYQENIEKAHLASLGAGISGAAHCIKNIVTIMTMGFDCLKYGIQDGDMAMIRSSREPLQEGCQRISELVMDMLSYAKQRIPEPTPVDLNALLMDIVKMIRPACDAKRIAVEEHLDPEVGVLMLDKNGIHRCIMNFISNAMDALAGKPDGRMTLRTKLDREIDEIEVQIQDNGSGIPEDKLGKIFDVFFSTKGSKGTGLGLATTRKIIHEHGETVRVQSKTADGTVFFVSLPVRRGG